MQRIHHISAALVAAMLAAPSLAQFGGPMGGMGGGPPGGGPGGRSGQCGSVMASGGRLVATTEQQLDNLRFQLKLRPEQESAWLDYQEKVGALVADHWRPAPQEAQAKDNALRQVERKIDVVRNRLTAMEDIVDAAKRLYEKLDEQQQATADRLLATTVPPLYSGLGQERPGGRDRPDKGGLDGRGPSPD